MDKKLTFLVIDGYTPEAREHLVSGGASMASDLYRKMLASCSPLPVECEVVYPSDPGAKLPAKADLDAFDGIAWTGCSLCINDDIPPVVEQLQLARDAFAVGVPSFGTCWGIQIAAVAAGGRVEPNPNGREMGVGRKITLTQAGLEHPFYEGKSQVFDGFSSHDDEITYLPPGATILAGNTWTGVQAACVTHQKGTAWALQYHPEYDLREMARLTYCRIEKLIRLGFFKTENDALEYVDQLEQLHNDPTRKDLSWRLGIDADLMDESVRQQEVKNWINHLVIPHKHQDTEGISLE